LFTTYINSKPAFKKGSEIFSYFDDDDYDDDDDNDDDNDHDDDDNDDDDINNKWEVQKKTKTVGGVFRIFASQSGGTELKILACKWE
jgi:hypothetical protein